MGWRTQALKRAFIKEVLKLPEELMNDLEFSEDVVDGEYHIDLHPNKILGRQKFAMLMSRVDRFKAEYIKGGFGTFRFFEEDWW